MVIGDRRKYLVALILIDEDNVTKFAQDNRIPFATFAELTQAPEIQKLIAQEVDQVNRTLSQVESIKKFALLPRRFYEEEGDVTPTKKVKRRNLESATPSSSSRCTGADAWTSSRPTGRSSASPASRWPRALLDPAAGGAGAPPLVGAARLAVPGHAWSGSSPSASSARTCSSATPA